ncbi:MAG: NAD-dependent epimerase/dehydratase family protein [Endomicrobiaceae bacterium]|nr:NAD-dependent epimerase/dehydratase family protein [Endomicrobiaceae bacterium]
MKILVTGGAGFIGSNIVDALIVKKHKVTIIDDLSTGNLKNLNKKAKFYKFSVTDRAKINKTFKKEKFDIVIHHAAQLDVRKSVEDPLFDADVNIKGSLNILEACKNTKVKKIIFASSGGTMYGECPNEAPAETVTANPLSPYGVAKNSVENYIKSYSSIYGLKYTVLRYANVYGPRQDPHGEAGVVAIFIGKMLKNQEVLIFGNGKQMRDYVFVSDVVSANLQALTKGNNEIFNIGTQTAFSVNQLAKEISNIIGYKLKPKYMAKRSGELFKNFLNISKAKKTLSWKPQVSIQTGLKKTVEYFMKNK